VNLMMKQCCRIIVFALIGAIPFEVAGASNVKLVGSAQTTASLMEPLLGQININEAQLPDDTQDTVPDQSKTGEGKKNRRKYSSSATFAMAVLGAAALLPVGPRAAVYVSL